MNNIIVATFLDDKTAIDGAHRLNELDLRGDIVVYNSVLIRRNRNGTFDYLKDDRDLSGWNAMSGMLIGTVIGVIGGPVGALAGMFAGLTVGGFADIAQYSFDYEFLETFKKGLPIGTTSLVAQVSEPNVIFINNALDPLTPIIYRSNVYAEQDRFVSKQIDMLDAGIEEAEAELRHAAADKKADIQAKIAVRRARRDAKVAEIKADFHEDVEATKADIERVKRTLQGKVDDVRRRVLERRLAHNEAKAAKYEAEAQKLNMELTKSQTAQV